MTKVCILAVQASHAFWHHIHYAQEVAKDFECPIELVVFAYDKTEIDSIYALSAHVPVHVKYLVHPGFRHFIPESMGRIFADIYHSDRLKAVIMTHGFECVRLLPYIAGRMQIPIYGHVCQVNIRQNQLVQQQGRRQPSVVYHIDQWPCALSIIPPNITTSPSRGKYMLSSEEIFHVDDHDVEPTRQKAINIPSTLCVVGAGRTIGQSMDTSTQFLSYVETLRATPAASAAGLEPGCFDGVMQIGQTGQVALAEVYLACAISGAVGHMRGVLGSRLIVAINHAKNAPIFDMADYGFVGDWNAALRHITDEATVNEKKKDVECL